MEQELVQDSIRPKETLYKAIAHSGIWFLSKFFPEYFAVEPLRPTDRYIEYPFILQNLPKESKKILDVGCSGSMLPLLMKSLGHEIVGVDIRNYYPSYKFFFVKGDIRHELFREESFDIITAVSSIEHIGLKGRYGQEEHLDGDIIAVREIHRILKPGGEFLMTVPLGDRLQITQNHRIYTIHYLWKVFSKFKVWHHHIEQSPEADYKLCLIIARK